MKKVLVTGANGQLGRCIRDAAKKYSTLEFIFASRSLLNVDEEASVEKFFEENQFDYCINTAAYTNVEKAERDTVKAFHTNAEAARIIAEQCERKGIVLLHISTDYVFDGEKGEPYVEEDETNPINVYGSSKLKGEEYIEKSCKKYFIFRTSWLYSQYGHNFLNTILKYASEGKDLTITTEQVGVPTNANDLAKVLIEVIAEGSEEYGLYHACNLGQATWYDFAKEILTITKQIKNINLAKTEHYSTFAARPKYSVLSIKKVEIIFKSNMVRWQDSLYELLN